MFMIKIIYLVKYKDCSTLLSPDSVGWDLYPPKPSPRPSKGALVRNRTFLCYYIHEILLYHIRFKSLFF